MQLNFVLKRDPGVTILQLLPMRHVVRILIFKRDFKVMQKKLLRIFLY